jgi:aryl-alcohol dehydrogenase-like predicted oxidoreductase
MAGERGVTAAQLALAWVLAQGNDVVPIPGARKIPHLEDNVAAADIALSDDDIARIGSVMADVQGERYGQREAALIDRK